MPTARVRVVAKPSARLHPYIERGWASARLPCCGLAGSSCSGIISIESERRLQYEELSDADLIALCREGHEAAWSTLVRRYQRLIFTVPRRAGLSEGQAADVFQTCFEKLYRHIDRIDDAGRVRAWLVTTARRETLRLIEQSRRIVDLAPTGRDGDGDDDAVDPLDRFADPHPLPEALLADLQEHDRVRRAMERLDPRSCQLLELLFLQHEPLPYADIAARLGIAEGSIGPLRARALSKVRDLLKSL
jgi:RNA polymerase sigma factor (sigma-70 family)